MSEIKIIIVEDEPLILEELADTLVDLGYEVIGKFMEGPVAVDALNHLKPDLVFLDINLNGPLSGIDIGNQLSKEKTAPFIYLTSYGDRKTIAEASKTEPLNYLIKPFTDEALLSAIEVGMYNYSKRFAPGGMSRDIINSKILNQITEKEYEILEAIFKGQSNYQIAELQYISRNTVKTHIKNIYNKLDVHNRSELLARLRELL